MPWELTSSDICDKLHDREFIEIFCGVFQMERTKNENAITAIMTLEGLTPETTELLAAVENISLFLTSMELSNSFGRPMLPAAWLPASSLSPSDVRAEAENRVIFSARESTGKTREDANSYMRARIPEWLLNASNMKGSLHLG